MECILLNLHFKFYRDDLFELEIWSRSYLIMGIQNCQAYKLWTLNNLVRFRYLITIHFWNWTIIILPGKCISDCIFFKTFFWKTQKEKPACFTFDYIQIAHEQINSRHIHTCITIKCRIWINIAAFKDSHEETVHIIIKNNSSVTLWTTLPNPPPPSWMCLSSWFDLTLPWIPLIKLF